MSTGKILRSLILAALVWAVVNCIYVYGVLHGGRAHRVETAALIFIALLLPQVVRNDADHVRHEIPEAPPLVRRLLLSASVAIVLWTYVPLLTFPFLSDDYVFLDRYTSAESTLARWQFFRPVFAVVFWAVATAGSGSVVPFHVLSVALHLGCAWLGYRLTHRQFRSRTAAAVAFSVFALNPVQLEAVLWISGLQELLWTFFLLTATYVYTRSPVLSATQVVLTAGLLVAALGSKETAVCFSVLLPAADYVLFRFHRGRWLPIAYSVFVLELIVYFALRQQLSPLEAQYFIEPSRYFVKELLITPYVAFLYPWNTSAIHVSPFVLAAVCVLSLTALCVAVVRRGAGAAAFVGPAIILVSTLPVYSFFYVSSELQGARYLYLASLGWAVLVAEITRRLARDRTGMLVIAGILIVAYSGALWGNLRPWRTAGAIVADLQDAHRKRADLTPLITGWSAALGPSLLIRDGIPREYQGVMLFRNGYPEFVKITQQRRVR